MGYSLRKGVSACVADGTVVLLDLDRDRYFAVAATASTGARTVGILDDATLARLLDMKLAVPTPGAGMPAFCPPAPAVTGCAWTVEAHGAPLPVAGAIARTLVARAELRLSSLSSVLSRLEIAKGDLPRDPPSRHTIASIGGAFGAASRVTSGADRCLARSIAIARAMLAKGVAPLIVIGVRLNPFAAHCWVQHGGVLMSDEPGTIAPYTPVLIL